MNNLSIYAWWRSFALLAAVVILAFVACKRESLIGEKESLPQNQFKSLTLRQQLMQHTEVADFKDAYTVLSPEQKYNIWLDKLNIMMASGDFSIQEKSFLQELLDLLDISIFQQGYDVTALEAFSEDWSSRAISQLGWTEEQTQVVAMTIFTLEEYNDRIEAIGGGGLNPPPPSSDCECAYSTTGCWVWSFGKTNYCDRYSDCSPVDGGCGFLLVMQCRGVCKKR